MVTDYAYKYARDFDEDTPKLLEYLMNGGKDKKIIKKMCLQGLSLIDQKYDCSDFRIEIFTRILASYKKVIGQEVEHLITTTLFRFPFEDMSCHSMCTWTENHQLIIDVNEYLLGNMYPNNSFYGNMLGKELASNAYNRLNDWCDFIFRFGFSEYGSTNYYPETLAALGNIIEFCQDEQLKEKFKIVLDLLVYDIFSSMTPDLTYNKATARAYVDNKINYYNYLKPHIDGLLGKTIKVNHEREACFFLMLKAKDKHNKLIYQTPKVFIDIFKSKEKELKESNGLNANEYRRNGLLKHKDKNVLYLMTTGTSNSYVALRNVSKYISKHKMWNHSMLASARPYRFIIKVAPKLFIRLMKRKKHNLKTISYGRGNTYTYVKNNYSISSLTRYQVNKPSFQQVTHMLNLDGLSVFTTAPAKATDKTGSPDYWIGSRKNADCIQHKNILVVYYHKPKLTHMYFPLEQFDQVNLDNLNKGLIFARYHNINLFIKTNSGIYFAESNNDKSIHQDDKTSKFNLKKYDLVNTHARNHYYLFEVDDTLSFIDFIKNVKAHYPYLSKKVIIYKGLKYTYKKPCYFHNELIKTSYPRFMSEFIENNEYIYNKNNYLTFISKNNKLTIDFNNFTRSEK